MLGVCPGTHGSRAWLAELSRGVGMEEVSIADEASAAAEAEAAAEEEETMATRLQGAGGGGTETDGLQWGNLFNATGQILARR